ncbi:MAG: hypothetical protein MZV64_09400 [Ignavibacteriales bacterium]|nr:hypothetical protein [Ignavibacteriales bacterium]
MLAMGRALMTDGRSCSCMDEPSLGLAPLLVADRSSTSSAEITSLGKTHPPGGAERLQGPRGRRPGLRPGAGPHREGRAGRRGQGGSRRPRRLPGDGE